MKTKIFFPSIFYSVVFLMLLSPLFAIPMMEERPKEERGKNETEIRKEMEKRAPSVRIGRGGQLLATDQGDVDVNGKSAYNGSEPSLDFMEISRDQSSAAALPNQPAVKQSGQPAVLGKFPGGTTVVRAAASTQGDLKIGELTLPGVPAMPVLPFVPQHNITDATQRSSEAKKMAVPSASAAAVTRQDEEEDYGDTIVYKPAIIRSANTLKTASSTKEQPAAKATSSLKQMQTSGAPAMKEAVALTQEQQQVSLDVLRLQKKEEPQQVTSLYPPIPDFIHTSQEGGSAEFNAETAATAHEIEQLIKQPSAPPMPDTMYFVPSRNAIVYAPTEGEIIEGYKTEAAICFVKASEENRLENIDAEYRWMNAGGAFEKAAEYKEEGEVKASDFCIQAATAYRAAAEDPGAETSFLYQRIGAALFYQGRIQRYAELDSQVTATQLDLLDHAIADYRQAIELHNQAVASSAGSEKNKRLSKLYERSGISLYQEVMAERYRENKDFSASRAKNYHIAAQQNYILAIPCFAGAIRCNESSAQASQAWERAGMAYHELGDDILESSGIDNKSVIKDLSAQAEKLAQEAQRIEEGREEPPPVAGTASDNCIVQ